MNESAEEEEEEEEDEGHNSPFPPPAPHPREEVTLSADVSMYSSSRLLGCEKTTRGSTFEFSLFFSFFNK